MEKIKVGIIGAAGYTGGELIRLLVNHLNAELVFAQSSSNAGKPISSVHTDLLGETEQLFSAEHNEEIDVLFLCGGHGAAQKFLNDFEINSRIAVIDLSHDFRLKEKNELKGRKFVYGLPELNREAIKQSKNIANPGCFATAIQLALLPLVKENLLSDDVHINAITGSTGAGQSLSETSHFSWRNNNISTYKVFKHQHLGEITESVKQLQKNFAHDILFIPQRGNFTRGIFATAYTKFDGTIEQAIALYKTFYASHSFVQISETPIELKQVVNTNRCFLHLEKIGDNLVVTSAIDNLLKGASGQAIQNMNLIFGLPENTGLKLKATAF